MDYMIKIYTKSLDAWDAIFKSIKNARRSIYIEMYIFSDNTSNTHDFVGLLEEKAKSGLQVILILDAFGSIGLNKKVIDRLVGSGAEVLFFHHWFSRTHRKLVIIDGETSFNGGVNIFNNSKSWNDLNIKGGKQLSQNFVKIFKRTYVLAKGKNILIENKDSFKKYKIRAWIIDHFPIAGRKTLRKYYENKLSNASNSIFLVTPYFAPSKWFIETIKKAIYRNVKVSILIPQNTDHYFLDKMNLYYSGIFYSLGCKVYFLNEMNHAKAMLIDDEEGMIGSGNLDSMSFERNSELGVFFTNTRSIKELKNIINFWIQKSSVYNGEIHRLYWYEIILVPILKILHPIL